MDSDREGTSAKRQKMNTDITALCQAGLKQDVLHIPSVCFAKVASYLQVGELLVLRSVCTELKKIAHDSLQKRAIKRSSRALPWQYELGAGIPHIGSISIQFKQGWTEEFRSLEGVIQNALSQVRTNNWPWPFDDRELETFSNSLKKFGMVCDDRFVELSTGTPADFESDNCHWSREVQFVEDMSVTTAAKKIGEMFKRLEDTHSFKYCKQRGNPYTYLHKCAAEVEAEKEAQADQIRAFKQVCFALLFSSTSTITMSRIKCEEVLLPCYSQYEMSKFVYHFGNNMELIFEAYRHWTVDWYSGNWSLV